MCRRKCGIRPMKNARAIEELQTLDSIQLERLELFSKAIRKSVNFLGNEVLIPFRGAFFRV